MSKAIRAIDVRAIDLGSLSRGTPGISTNSLPTVLVNLEEITRQRTAVTSWRWDISGSERASANIHAAIALAQSTSIDYLFVDIVSVDQKLPGDELIAEVLAFAKLYGDIPVVAAYDDANVSDWLPTMRRPWIVHEARTYVTNPTSVTYIGHQRDQGSRSNFGFTHMFKRVTETNYTTSLWFLLFGRTGMTKVSDLRYIIPEHLALLTKCATEMEDDDLILTAAIVCQALSDDASIHAGTYDTGLEPLNKSFKRYKFRAGKGPDRAYTYHDILFDGRKVGQYFGRVKADRITMQPSHVRYLGATSSARRDIYSIMGLSSSPELAIDEKKLRRLFDLPSTATQKPTVRVEHL